MAGKHKYESDTVEVSEAELNRFNSQRIAQGKPPLAPTTRYKRPRGLNMSDEGWQGLKDLAKQLGYVPPYEGNITQLLESIGHGQWILTPAN